MNETDTAVEWIEKLEAERRSTVARLAHVDAALTAIRALVAEDASPSRRSSGRPPATKKTSKSAARRAVHSAAVLRALKSGPLPAGQLAKQAGVSSYVLNALVKKGIITATGHTSGRRYARTEART